MAKYKDTNEPPTLPEATSPPSPIHPSTTTNTPHPYTFTQIIDADHFTIQSLAKRIRALLPVSSSTPHPTHSTATTNAIPTLLINLKPLLTEVTHRLIRHDLSEDLVMRPAFTSILGSEGQRMAEHDRVDHENARRELLSILERVADLEGVLTSSTSALAAPNVHSSTEDVQKKVAELADMVTRTFTSLGNHMATESGQFLPYFESIIDETTSRRLAMEYTCTLVLTPDVTVNNRNTNPIGTPSESSESRGEDARKPLFPSGVTEYINSDLTRLRTCYEMVLEDAKLDGGAYMDGMGKREIERLQVGKWMGLNERRALRDGGGGGTGVAGGGGGGGGGGKGKL
ncbi:hypothetical protein PMZ80_000336 [Knufia obscura]|uniref:Uncharacterized protein n=1 Tax=Knufia obscura TaxID=1635080 RepID=A0ABR0S030_9EURO|nr:hypothetical protein PMZ80_000336 [Knufia obscura]